VTDVNPVVFVADEYAWELRSESSEIELLDIQGSKARNYIDVIIRWSFPTGA
jgi:hypothetical protein